MTDRCFCADLSTAQSSCSRKPGILPNTTANNCKVPSRTGAVRGGTIAETGCGECCWSCSVGLQRQCVFPLGFVSFLVLFMSLEIVLKMLSQSGSRTL
ncbi:uncharacterized protein ASCRUDRAFT_115588 [Ascoidea rubescens DSM 1968]|uniref:Uncharacterized protein n=1 Tax=Ascoidea rubescens DSM 1968 TaxID=1344418 RepID=A0A1D2VC00_9ASCO|nr:hypothetical protein ASCRUDRAFT_115588 [Ascoidea rubescens DSM 1968]ODV59013.1 hypothetical protein ASCRUDRAFT_115588 [Ascoidea rubescens DSM 1968]